jgi:alanyl-tRNA synthetase
MEKTKLLYHNDTYQSAALTQISDVGQDEKGNFLILTDTIYYPGGGGQPKDIAYIGFGNQTEATITGADFNGGFVKHYVDSKAKVFEKGMQVSMTISQQQRLLYSAYHTAGHWLASIVNENMQIPYTPLKGYHYTDGAYIEFEGDKALLTDQQLEDIHYCIRVDLQSNPKVTAEIISFDDTEKLKRANKIANFTPQPDKPLRLVTIDGYAPVPCGGTHVGNLRDIRSVTPMKVVFKNGKVRLCYQCEVHYPVFS